MIFKGFTSDRRGATATEFALVVTPLLLLLFGSFEFGRLIWVKQGVEEAAISGARCMGVLNSGCADADGKFNLAKTKSYVNATARSWGISLDSNRIVADRNARCNDVSGFSKITVSYDFSSPLPYFAELLTEASAVSADACFPNQS